MESLGTLDGAKHPACAALCRRAEPGASLADRAVEEVLWGFAVSAGAGIQRVLVAKALVVVGEIPMPRAGRQKVSECCPRQPKLSGKSGFGLDA